MGGGLHARGRGGQQQGCPAPGQDGDQDGDPELTLREQLPPLQGHSPGTKGPELSSLHVTMLSMQTGPSCSEAL